MADYLEKQVRLGKDAAAFVLQDAWISAVARVKEKYHQDFINSRMEDSATREAAYRKISALADIETELKKVADNGLHAEHELKRSIRKP